MKTYPIQKKCCEISCQNDADWDIFDDSDPYAGTQACDVHLALLLGVGWHRVVSADWDNPPA